MPTATSLSGYSIFNNGPLTTAFTAPASCATIYETMVAPATEPTFFEWEAPSCNFVPPANCNPNGAAIQSIFSSAEGGNPSAGQIIVYHSPGLACPSGWETVGGAAKLNPTSTSISGAFNVSEALPTGVAIFEQDLDVILAALDPGETAAVCCPSSYTTMGAVCYSTLPSSVFTPTAGCQRLLPPGDVGTISGTFTIGGQTLTGELATFTGTTPPSTTTTSFASSDAASLIGVAVQGMFILVHKASDTSGGAGSSTASSTSSTKPNSAVSVRGIDIGLGIVATVCCVSFALGALLVV
ncbi:hypothetical protein N431DRAFT_557298 [Stipitochalara longipes BDJ]|nr:hypothetical protein N431DRAFT_557298 [Stipitochalara longipes BDJ]